MVLVALRLVAVLVVVVIVIVVVFLIAILLLFLIAILVVFLVVVDVDHGGSPSAISSVAAHDGGSSATASERDQFCRGWR
jgi:hypothetical protein